MGYDFSVCMFSFSFVLWGNDVCYYVFDMGFLGFFVIRSFGIEKWLSDGFFFG